MCHKVCTSSVDDFSAMSVSELKPHALRRTGPWISSSSSSSSVVCWTPPGKVLPLTLREDLISCKSLTFIDLQ